MRIVAINASHRGDRGRTRFFIDELFHGATERGADCEVVTLAKQSINRCLACRRCQEGEPCLVCVYHEKDNMAVILDKMSAADIFVFATPIYMMNMTGLLKNFLDRLYSTMLVSDVKLSNGLLHHHLNPAISSKPFALLVLCENVEPATSKSVPSYFRTYARFMEARQVGVIVRNVANLFEHPEDPAVTKEFPKIPEVLRAYRQAGRELAELGYIRRSTQRKAAQEVVPFPLFGLLKRFRLVKNKIIAYQKKVAAQLQAQGK